jgi:hypothetical protein
MTAAAGLLQRALAVWDGHFETPSGLEAELAKPEYESAPLNPKQLAAAIMPELECLWHGIPDLSAFTESTAQHLARLLGWMIETFRTWDPNVDARHHRLEAALIAATFWDMDGDLWETLDPMLPKRDTFCCGLGLVIQSRGAQFQVPANTPIWEREHLETLQKADAASDWAGLSETIQAFRAPILDSGAAQAVRAIWVLDRSRLVALADRIETWTKAGPIAASLSLAAAFRLATESSSGHVRFSALDRVANRVKRMLSDDEEDALKNLFVILARDDAAWPVWLSVCNRYPVRHPNLQRSLGRALARSTASAISAYVDSIQLSTPNAEGRECVAKCLEEFRGRATPSRRHALWSCAFKRWKTWNFGATDGTGLGKLGQSELDYAVTGWLVEYVDPSLLAAEEETFADQLKALEAEWYSSRASLATGFYRLLSRYQMFAFARTRTRESSDWLSDGAIVTPPALGEFARARYRFAGS